MIDREIVPGKLRVLRRIGAGGMGVVYEAIHLGLERRVAVKVIHPQWAESKTVRSRFLREARALALLPSDHIVQVLDVDTLAEGDPYMVMEYLEGRDLKRELNKRGPLPVAEAVGYLVQACAGVAAAHSVGIVHRDIKPANIFISNLEGARLAKILDFGVAKFTTSSDACMTAPTDTVGTTSYMAPEQLGGLEAGPRSDVWSLGVVLFEVLTGRSPFRVGTSRDTVHAVLNAVPASLHEERSDVPLSLALVVRRCLEKSPADRFADAGELALALEPFAPTEWVVRPSLRAARGSSAPPAAGATPLKAHPIERSALNDPPPSSSTPDAVTVVHSVVPVQSSSLPLGLGLPGPHPDSALPEPDSKMAVTAPAAGLSARSPSWRRLRTTIASLALLGVALAICWTVIARRAAPPAVVSALPGTNAAAPPLLVTSRPPVAETATEPAARAPLRATATAPTLLAPRRPLTQAASPARSPRAGLPPGTAASAPTQAPPTGTAAVPLHL